ncbi:MAG: hypothetical protein ACQEQ7_13655 [Thermodesulfobacteriota bacterium]
MQNCLRYSQLMILTLILLMPVPLPAHGVKGDIFTGGMVITARYDTDEPMSYAQTIIRPPEGGLDFQTGRTDRNGRFCFFPDGPGDWEVIVDDGIGHRLTLVVPVDERFLQNGQIQTDAPTRNAISKPAKALMGLCIIFGISGCLLWWKARKPTSSSLRQKDK